MRRVIYVLLLATFVGASATCLSASTDCERWFVAYRQELAHSRQVQRIAAAKRRAKLYARRKLAGYVKPKPRPHPFVHHGPRMTPRQTLRHFDLACGVLPEDQQEAPEVAEETPSEFQPGPPLGDGLEPLPADIGDMIAENTVPPPFDTGAAGAPAQGGPYGFPPALGGGYAPSGGSGYVPPGNGTTVPPNSPPASGTSSGPGSGQPAVPPVGVPPSGSPAGPSGPPTAPPSGPPTPLPPPPAVVPEPDSYILMLTGLVGAAGLIRRRFQA